MTFTGTVKMWRNGQPESGTATLIADKGGPSRVVWLLPSGAITEQWTPSAAGDALTGKGQKGLVTQPAGASILMPALAWFAPGQVVAEVSSGRYRAADLGPATHDGAAAEHLILTLSRLAGIFAQASEGDLYLDPATGLPSAAVFRVRPYRAPGAPRPPGFREWLGREEVRYADYRPVAGRMIPFRIQAFMGNKPIFDIALTGAAFDQGTQLGPLN